MLVLLRLHVVEELLQLAVVCVCDLRLDPAVAEVGEAVLQTTLPVAVVGGQRELRAQALGGQQ